MSLNVSYIDLEQLSVKKLSEELDLSSFDCSVDDTLGLNEFIHKEALEYQKERMGITYVFCYQSIPVGYVTLAMYTIEVKETRLQRLRIIRNEKRYPALLLGRLGVDNNYRERHIGRNMCLWVVGLAKAHSNEIGCRFVVVLTKKEKVEFYKKCEFEIAPKYENKEKILMYFQIPTET